MGLDFAKSRLRDLLAADEKYNQLLNRFCAPYIRDVLARFRSDQIKAAEAAVELNLSPRRFYQLYHSYLKAVGQRKSSQWTPGLSGGNRRKSWPKEVETTACRLLNHGCSYSAVASELRRRFALKTDRATVRRFAIGRDLAPQKAQI